MKSLKRTLIASAVCFVVCLALLVGTTFAWFTKNLVSPENYITMGKLDFTAKVASSDEGASAYTVTANEDLTFNFAEFEDFEDGESLITENNFAPGASGAKIISITNTGTLAEDVRIFVASNELSTLNNYVWFDLVKLTATQSGYEIAQGYTFEKKTLSEFETLLNSDSIQSRLEVGGVANYMLVYGVNLVDGNELADLTWQSYIYIQAKQANSAAQYGEVKLTTAQALSAAFATGGNYVLSEDVVIKPDTSDDSEIMTNDGLCAQLTVTADTTLDLNGKTIALDESIADISLTGTPCLISVENGATLTIEGDGAIDGEGGVNAEAGYNNSYGINVNGGTLIINSGEFYGAMSAVQVQTGELIINGGFFDLATTIKAVAPQYSKYLINCIDRYYQSGEAKISVYGGTFVNFDPSNSPEGADESYVADGCSVESEIQENGDTWYTVNDDRIPVNTVEGFTEALANGGYIVLDDDVTIDADAAYIKVTGDTVIDLNGNTLTTNDNISYRAENITIKNGTVEMNTALSSGGIPPLNFEGAKNVTLENIVVNGNGRAAGEISDYRLRALKIAIGLSKTLLQFKVSTKAEI